MALFSEVKSRLFSYMTPLKITQAYNKTNARAIGSRTDHALIEAGDSAELEGDTLLATNEPTKKRAARGTLRTASRKRRKTSVGSHSFEVDSSSDFEGPTLLASTPQPEISKSSADADKVLMPPPTVPKLKPFHSRRSMSTNDELSEMGSVAISAVGRREVKMLEDVDNEKARRYADAATLPADSGSWSDAEKDLFYRLAYRGFEPMLPRNWMIDFRTLPLSLYAHDEKDSPIIQTNLEPGFRAIRALREMIHLGERVRDRALSKHKPRVEPEIQQRVDRYLSWALTDIGMHQRQRPKVIPVHAITKLGRGQTTQDAINGLAADLHDLARRWRQHYDIPDSIEESEALTPDVSEEEESDVDNHNTDADDLPTLYGLLICSSLVMVVTMAAHATPATKLKQPPPAQDYASLHDSHDPGLRMIATFDFSKTGEDVWNALAIAIVVMKIRDTMLEQYERDTELHRVGRGSMWEGKRNVEASSPSCGEKNSSSCDEEDGDPDA